MAIAIVGVFALAVTSLYIFPSQAQTVVAKVPVGLGSSALAYDSRKGEVFASLDGNAVSVVSDATNRWSPM